MLCCIDYSADWTCVSVFPPWPASRLDGRRARSGAGVDRGVCEALKGGPCRRIASAYEAHEPVTLGVRLARWQFGDELEHVSNIADVGHQVIK